MRTLEENQWQCVCGWFSPEPANYRGLRENSERVHKEMLCEQYRASVRKRYSFDAKGRILEIRDGMIVVPYEQTRGGWYSVVVKATSERDQKSYPRGGYNIVANDFDIETAIEHHVDAAVVIPIKENS